MGMLLGMLPVLLPALLPPLAPDCWGPLPPARQQQRQQRAATDDVVVSCRSSSSDCRTADVQAALARSEGRRVIFPGAHTYAVTPLQLRANNTVLVFQPGAVLSAKEGSFVGGADTLLTVQGAAWGQSCNATRCPPTGCPSYTCHCPTARNISIVGYGARFQMRRGEYTRPPYHPTGLLIENKGVGWPVSIQNARSDHVSRHPCPYHECPDGPLWIEGRNEQCAKVLFGPNVSLVDDRPRWAVSIMGSVVQVRGNLTVHNAAGCVSAPRYPNVSLAISCTSSSSSGGGGGGGGGSSRSDQTPLKSDDDALFVLEAVMPSHVPNSGGTLLTVSGKGFDVANGGAATCKFFFNAEGFAWGVEGSKPPEFPRRLEGAGFPPSWVLLAPTPDPVTRASVLNSTHLQCTSPDLRMPLGSGADSCGMLASNCSWRQSSLLSGPISVDISMDGIHYTGRTPQQPSLLSLFSIYSASPGRKPYTQSNIPTALMLYRVQLLNSTSSDLTVGLTCGDANKSIFSSVRAHAGVHSVSFPVANLPISANGTVLCQSTLSSGGVAVSTVPLAYVVSVPSRYETAIDFERRSVIVDQNPFLPFGFGTQCVGQSCRAAQLYLSSRGINQFSHYFFAEFTETSRRDWAALLHDAAQLGIWVQAPASDKLNPYAHGNTKQQAAVQMFAKEVASEPAVWSYYVAVSSSSSPLVCNYELSNSRAMF
eukprot:COSAG06_NODE_1383_length_9621_cov_17.241966_7_plen_707_part_00